MNAKKQTRLKIPIDIQLRVLFRDGWLCRWCHRPTVFPLALKYLAKFVSGRGYPYPIAYYDFRNRRDAAPMLDHLAAVIDHVNAYSQGGVHAESNFATACNKCNLRKNNRKMEDYQKEKSGKPVKGKYGEPLYWDGFVSLFLILVRENKAALSASERKWYNAIETYLSQSEGKRDRLIFRIR